MATVKELNLRLGSLGNTKKITQAMKLISITKMNRMVQQVKGSREYQEGLTKVVKKITEENKLDHVLLNSVAKVKKIKVLLISSDRGLCGAFNSNLLKKFKLFLNEKKAENVNIEVAYCGKKGHSAYGRNKELIQAQNYETVIKDPKYATAVEIANELMDELLAGGYDELYLFYNHFESALVQSPTVKRLVPFDFEEDEESESVAKGGVTYFEPSIEALSEELMVKQLYFEVFFALLNSVTGENAARMRAMDSATKNCEEMIDSLTLQRNRMRQASITKELIEIISGAESL